jgi:hypothetical protein
VPTPTFQTLIKYSTWKCRPCLPTTVHKRAIDLNFCRTTYTYATQIVAHSYVHVWTTSRIYLYLYNSVTRFYTISNLISKETRMNHSLCHPCMYERGNFRVLEKVLELRTRIISCLALREERAALLCGGWSKGMHVVVVVVCRWLMHVVLVGIRWLGGWDLLPRPIEKFVEIAMVFKTPPFLLFSCVSHSPYLLLSARHISGFVYMIVEATMGVFE